MTNQQQVPKWLRANSVRHTRPTGSRCVQEYVRAERNDSVHLPMKITKLFIRLYIVRVLGRTCVCEMFIYVLCVARSVCTYVLSPRWASERTRTCTQFPNALPFKLQEVRSSINGMALGARAFPAISFRSAFFTRPSPPLRLSATIFRLLHYFCIRITKPSSAPHRFESIFHIAAKNRQELFFRIHSNIKTII